MPELAVGPAVDHHELVGGQRVPPAADWITRALFSPEASLPPSTLISRLLMPEVSPVKAGTPAAGITWKVSWPTQPQRGQHLNRWSPAGLP